jgi:hypothetical protein
LKLSKKDFYAETCAVFNFYNINLRCLNGEVTQKNGVSLMSYLFPAIQGEKKVDSFFEAPLYSVPRTNYRLKNGSSVLGER